MLFQSHIAIDQFTLKHSKGKESEILHHHFKKSASELGQKIVSYYPFKKDDEGSYKGELPALALNRDHPFVDRYINELVVIDRATFAKVLHLLLKPTPNISEAIKLMTHERIPLGADSTGTNHDSINNQPNL